MKTTANIFFQSSKKIYLTIKANGFPSHKPSPKFKHFIHQVNNLRFVKWTTYGYPYWITYGFKSPLWCIKTIHQYVACPIPLHLQPHLTYDQITSKKNNCRKVLLIRNLCFPLSRNEDALVDRFPVTRFLRPFKRNAFVNSLLLQSFYYSASFRESFILFIYFTLIYYEHLRGEP